MGPIWFSMGCTIHTDPKILSLAADLKLDPDTTVGKLGRLYAWAMISNNETGDLTGMPPSEIADIMRWKKKPEALVEALIKNGLIDNDDGRLSIHKWGVYNGDRLVKRRKDAERKK